MARERAGPRAIGSPRIYDPSVPHLLTREGTWVGYIWAGAELLPSPPQGVLQPLPSGDSGGRADGEGQGPELGEGHCWLCDLG